MILVLQLVIAVLDLTKVVIEKIDKINLKAKEIHQKLERKRKAA